jgi:hypothetical protein
MGSGGDAAEDGVGGVEAERLVGAAAGQQRAGDAVGEGRLADAARAGDQPGMVQAPGGARLLPDLLGRVVAEQVGVFAGCQLAPSNSISKIRVAPGGMTPPAPWSP